MDESLQQSPEQPATLYAFTQIFPSLDYAAKDMKQTAFTLSLAFLPLVLLLLQIFPLLSSRKTQARSLRLRITALTGTAPIYPLPQAPVSLPVTLPYTIRMRIGWEPLVRPAIFIVVLGPIFGFIFLVNGGGLAGVLPSLKLLIATPLIFVVSPLISLAQARWQTPRLTLNDESITARYGYDRVTMRWADVHFFAITSGVFAGNAGGASSATFELSDGEHVIRWLYTSTRIKLENYIPSMKQEEYVALMDTLPSWICSRTGQPLRDLRAG
ncbi:MAG TPA: hypothetical protein VKR06_29000 [Ktedonosporobacter sp.]|nr:hypothetical protein [Ktedonosporobacter sp.]